MKDISVRIKSIEIWDFKNVQHGFIDLSKTPSDCEMSVLGLYGQNGSGKTAIIDVLELLKYILSGRKVPNRFADYVRIDAPYSIIKYGFNIENYSSNERMSVYYSVKIRKGYPEDHENSEESHVELFDEVLSCGFKSSQLEGKVNTIVNTKTDKDIAFVPETKYYQLVGKKRDVDTNLLVAKKLALISSKSFIFSKELIIQIENFCSIQHYIDLWKSLSYFGVNELYVINTTNTALIGLNALPLAFNVVSSGHVSSGNLLINLNGTSTIPEETFEIVNNVIKNMNVVLPQLVPGLTVTVKQLGTEYNSKNVKMTKIQLFSQKNSKAIPLQYESEGIKKIVSILQLLIVAYNNKSFTVAIDELDSGIFEYLLGELLEIVSERGKGQLIFTSHNLRPLEKLVKDYIAFTTIDPCNRYVRIKGVKTTNNLRSFYYRDILLGEQKPPLYETTNNYKIAMAFEEAGEAYGE